MSREDDINQLDLLGIFHYVLGGIIAVFSCFPLIHIAIGTGLLLLSAPGSAVVGLIFVVMGSLFVILGWSMAICIIISGRKLRQRKGRTFSMVIAGIECMMIPFGTILGVFTLIALSKESVKELYQNLPR